jgi:hypothetical protein
MQMIDLETAVTLASDWHGGQTSPLYSFASTAGEIHFDKEAYLKEINSCYAPAIDTEVILEELDSLKEFFENCDLFPNEENEKFLLVPEFLEFLDLIENGTQEKRAVILREIRQYVERNTLEQ